MYSASLRGDRAYSGLGALEIIQQIGKGMFSVVFLAKCRKTGEKVALKKVQVFEMTDAKARQDCIQEITLLQKLDHPNIVRYLSSFVELNELHIVLELADGGDLSNMIAYFKVNNRLISESTIWRFFVQVCRAVDHMHSKRILHRDIKPANIFITSTCTVKLGDLGLARYFSSKTTAAHSLVGTPYYMSPERIREERYDFKSDVWSLGCLVYEMAVLQTPFHCEKMNFHSLCKRIEICDYPPLPSDLYSDNVQKVITDCICPNSADRPEISDLLLLANKMHEESSNSQ